MGSRGPIPKRSEERIRRNKDEVEITKIQAGDVVEQPSLGLDDPHPMIVDFWDSLGESAQNRFYEPSDWQYARFTLHFADQLSKSGPPSSQLLAAVNAAVGDLLVTEAQRPMKAAYVTVLSCKKLGRRSSRLHELVCEVRTTVVPVACSCERCTRRPDCVQGTPSPGSARGRTRTSES